jgi:hypothetical protein
MSDTSWIQPFLWTASVLFVGTVIYFIQEYRRDVKRLKEERKKIVFRDDWTE